MGKKSKTALRSSSAPESSSGPAVTTSSSSKPKLDTDLPKASEVSPDIASPEEQPVVKVNTSSLNELKFALDDAVREYFGRPELFKPSHVHQDVKLVLGYVATAVIGLVSAYAYKTSFQESRLFVLTGTVIYAILSGASTLYSMYIQKDTIFTGKRKTFAGRIETEDIKLASSVPTHTPTYTLSLTYVHSSNKGKAVIRQQSATWTKSFGAFFREDGTLAKDVFSEDLRKLYSQVVGE